MAEDEEVYADGYIKVPAKRWYHIADALTRRDELMEATLEVLGAINEKLVPTPTPAMPPAMPPAVPPPVPTPPAAPLVLPVTIERTIPPNKWEEIRLGMKTRTIYIHTDRDLRVKLKGIGPEIPVPASESPFWTTTPPNLVIDRISVLSHTGANIKVTISEFPIYWGRASPESSPPPSFSRRQTFWYWAATITQPAGTWTDWTLAGPDGLPYTVPAGRRLVIDLVNLSSDIAGVVQQVDLVEVQADGTRYRFGGSFFDTHAPLHMRTPLSAGSQVHMITYNYDFTAARRIWVKIDGFEEVW